MKQRKKIEKVELIPQPHGGAIRPPMKKGETVNPNGRPKGWVKQLAEELELDYDIKANKATVRTLLQTLAYLPRAKLEEINNNVDLPIAIRLFTRSIKKDWDVKSTDTIRGLISFEMGVVEPPSGDPNSISSFSPSDILIGFKHGLVALDLENLEKVSEMVESELQKKRSNEAKIING